MNIDTVRTKLLQGLVIPACPLPLDQNRAWSERHQRALTRYYVASGVGGIAVGVHSTQFAIRDPKLGLLEPVLESVSKELNSLASHAIVKIAGICGDKFQAINEAETALRFAYHAGLLSLTALRGNEAFAVACVGQAHNMRSGACHGVFVVAAKIGDQDHFG